MLSHKPIWSQLLHLEPGWKRAVPQRGKKALPTLFLLSHKPVRSKLLHWKPVCKKEVLNFPNHARCDCLPTTPPPHPRLSSCFFSSQHTCNHQKYQMLHTLNISRKLGCFGSASLGMKQMNQSQTQLANLIKYERH